MFVTFKRALVILVSVKRLPLFTETFHNWYLNEQRMNTIGDKAFKWRRGNHWQKSSFSLSHPYYPSLSFTLTLSQTISPLLCLSLSLSLSQTISPLLCLSLSLSPLLCHCLFLSIASSLSLSLSLSPISYKSGKGAKQTMKQVPIRSHICTDEYTSVLTQANDGALSLYDRHTHIFKQYSLAELHMHKRAHRYWERGIW